MTIQHQHPPSPQQNNPRSPHAKNPLPSHARPHRPPPLTRRKTPQGVQKVGAGWSRSLVKEEEEGMAASFLQFCATCEKQIIVPNNSILYCSESCRRKDSNKSPTYAIFNSSPSPPLSPFSNPSGDEYPIRDIVPQRSPTARTTPTYFCPPSPKSPPHSTSPTSSNSNERRPSVAQAYLQQFHMTISNLPRPPSLQHYHRHSQYSSAATTPSLSHAMTPASSVSTSTNNPSYGLSNRPLPPRHNPSYSASASPRSIDLVTPFTPSAPASLAPTNRTGSSASLKANTAANTRAQSGTAQQNELLYEKKYTLPSAGVAEGPGSLKQLLSFDERRKKG